jgi:hypothetical protein
MSGNNIKVNRTARNVIGIELIPAAPCSLLGCLSVSQAFIVMEMEETSTEVVHSTIDSDHSIA